MSKIDGVDCHGINHSEFITNPNVDTSGQSEPIEQRLLPKTRTIEVHQEPFVRICVEWIDILNSKKARLSINDRQYLPRSLWSSNCIPHKSGQLLHRHHQRETTVVRVCTQDRVLRSYRMNSTKLFPTCHTPRMRDAWCRRLMSHEHWQKMAVSLFVCLPWCTDRACRPVTKNARRRVTVGP